MSEVVFEFKDGETMRFKLPGMFKSIYNTTGRPVKATLPKEYEDTSISNNVFYCLHPTKGKMVFV